MERFMLEYYYMKYVFALLFMLTAPAFAEQPTCNMVNNGIAHCIADRMCQCKYFSPSLIKNDPGGYRWDCGIYRPACIDPNKIEEVKPYDGPEAIGLGDTDNSINSEVGDGSTSTIELNN